MRLTGLDHYTLRTADLEATRRFYVELLGLREGPRPPFSFPGAWLYLGEQPVVHLVGGRRAETGGERKSGGTGALDHVAFRATDAAALRERLRSEGVAFRERRVPLLGLYQIFLHDPDGVMLELNFPAEETPAELG